LARLLALCSWAYPSVPLVGPWPTADGWIPWRILQGLLADIAFAITLRRVVLTQGVGLGAAVAFGEDTAKDAARADTEALGWQ
jgi:hypothetical protein